MKRLFYFLAIFGLSVTACQKSEGLDEKDVEVKITINPSTVIVEADETSSTFTLTCNAEWTISEDIPWVTAVSPSSGNAVDKQLVTITVEPNPDQLRSGKIIIASGDVTEELTISQGVSSGKEVFGKVYVMEASLIEDAAGFNMLSDGDFEDTGNQSLGIYTPWWALYSERVVGGAQSGDAFCRLNHDDIDESLGFQTVCTKPNTDYTVTAWFLSNKESESPDTYFGLRIGTGIRPVNFETRLGDDFTTSWKQFSVTGNVGNNPISEAFAFVFHKTDYILSWDNVVLKRSGDTQKSYKLTDVIKKSDFLNGTSGDITSSDGCTAWVGPDGQTCFAFGRNVGNNEIATKENAFATMASGSSTISVLKNDGKVVEILPKLAKEGGILPTGGIYAGGKHWVHFQIIRTKEFGSALWRGWGAGLASSTDGVTWTRSDVSFDRTGNFMEAAFLKDGGYVYMYGSRIGRGNEENTLVADEHYVKVARCPEAEMGTPASWKYWNGSDWVADEVNAVPIVYTGTLGEFSVIKNDSTGRYLMIYSSIKRNAIVVRDAGTPEGDWSGEHIAYPFEENQFFFAPSFLSVFGNKVTFLVSDSKVE
jgi:hypothetical protein